MRRAKALILSLCMVISQFSIFDTPLKVQAAPATDSWDLNYTGYVQEWTAPKTGKYYMEITGAGSAPYGKGGKTTGYINLTAGQKLYVCIGGAGGINLPAGYNGGGAASNGAGSGGGATSVTTTNRGVLANFDNYRNEVVAVAGGAGGMPSNGDTLPDRVTSFGSGCIDENGVEHNQGNGGGYSSYAVNLVAYYYDWDYWEGRHYDNSIDNKYNIAVSSQSSTQKSGYEFGKGQDSIKSLLKTYKPTEYFTSGAGGGGYYGGYTITKYGILGGSGGSGYSSPSLMKAESNIGGGTKGNGTFHIEYSGDIECSITIDLGTCGTYEGKSNSITISGTYGTNYIFKNITLNSGYTFVCWQRLNKYTGKYEDIGNSVQFEANTNIQIRAKYKAPLKLNTYNNNGKVNIDFAQDDNYTKKYILMESTNGIDWIISNTSDADIKTIETVKDFGFVEGVQTYTTKEGYTYKLEVWGAQGGMGSSHNWEETHIGSWGSEVFAKVIPGSTIYNTGQAAKGGYAFGMLNKAQTLYIVTGGQGGSDNVYYNSYYGYGNFIPLYNSDNEYSLEYCRSKGGLGGYNGGGRGGSFGFWNSSGIGETNIGGGGGGATHIATTNRGTLNNYKNYKSEVLIVAGGGGGGSSSGIGGGAQGQAGDGPSPGGGGSENAGGEPGIPAPDGISIEKSAGNFGLGGQGFSSNHGGGGGWYGGGASASNLGGTGGGGSGYINTDKLFNYGYDSTQLNSGNGRARITKIERITTEAHNYGVQIKDTAAPNVPSNGEIYRTTSKDYVLWNDNGDNGNDIWYKVKSVDVETDEDLNITAPQKFNATSGVKGWHYYIDKNSTGTATKSNTFTSTPQAPVTLDYEPQYLHVACVDNAGNLSATYNYKIQGEWIIRIHENKPDTNLVNISLPTGWAKKTETDTYIEKNFTTKTDALPIAKNVFTTSEWRARAIYRETPLANGQGSGKSWSDGQTDIRIAGISVIDMYVTWKMKYIPLTAVNNGDETVKLNWTPYIGENTDRFKLKYSTTSNGTLTDTKKMKEPSYVFSGRGWSESGSLINNSDTSSTVRNKYIVDVEALDLAAPDTPNISKYENNIMTFISKDNGTTYWYRAEAYETTNTTNSPDAWTKEYEKVDKEINQGLKGFWYYLDDSETASQSSCLSGTYVAASSDLTFNFNVNTDNTSNYKYLHILAVDKAKANSGGGNRSKILTIELPAKDYPPDDPTPIDPEDPPYEKGDKVFKLTFDAQSGTITSTGEKTYTKKVIWKFKGWHIGNACSTACTHSTYGYYDNEFRCINNCLCKDSNFMLTAEQTGWKADSDVLLRMHYDGGRTTLVQATPPGKSIFIGWYTKPQSTNVGVNPEVDSHSIKYGGGTNGITDIYDDSWNYNNVCLHTVNTNMTLYAYYNQKPIFVDVYEGLFFEGQKVSYKDLMELVGVFDYEDNYQKLQEEVLVKYFEDLGLKLDEALNDDLAEEEFIVGELDVLIYQRDNNDLSFDSSKYDMLNEKLAALRDHIAELYKSKEQIEQQRTKEIQNLPDRTNKLLSIDIAQIDYYEIYDEPITTNNYRSNKEEAQASNGLFKVDSTTRVDYDNTYLKTKTSNIGKITITYQVSDKGIWFNDPTTGKRGMIPNSDITLEYTRACQINFNYNPLVYTQGVLEYSNQDNALDVAKRLVLQQAAFDSEDTQDNIPWWSKGTDLKNLLLHEDNSNTLQELQDTIIITGIDQFSFNSAFEYAHSDAVEQFKKQFSSPEYSSNASEHFTSIGEGYYVGNELKPIYDKKELLNYIASFKGDNTEYYNGVSKAQIYKALNSIYITLDAHDQWGKWASNNVSKANHDNPDTGIDTSKKPKGYIPKFNGGNDIDENGGEGENPDPGPGENPNKPYDYTIVQDEPERSAVIVIIDEGNTPNPDPGDDETLYSDLDLNGTKIQDNIRYINNRWLETLGNSYWGNYGLKEITDILQKNEEEIEQYIETHSGKFDTQNGDSIEIEINEY